MTLARNLVLGVAAAGVMAGLAATGAQAADLVSYRNINSPTAFYNDPAGFAFDGFYAGIQAGAVVAGGVGGTVGGLAGVNFAVSDMFYLGAEVQADAWFTGAGFVGFDAIGLARLGVLLTDNTMIYGAVGGGVTGAIAPVYALGAGIEFGVADSIGLRAEGLALGPWGGAPVAGKLQAGLIFHIN